jgi:hypothetical protein
MMTPFHNYSNKIQQLLASLLLGIFFLAGCGGPGGKEEKSQEKKELSIEKEIELVTKEFRKMGLTYERLLKDNESAIEIGGKVLAMALYHDKQGKQCMIAALSGQHPQVESPKGVLISSLKEELKIFEPLKNSDFFNKDRPLYSKKDMANNEWCEPIGTLTCTKLVTIDVNSTHENLRNTEAEIHLINHMFEFADLSKDIYLCSSKPLCPSCGGVVYYRDNKINELTFLKDINNIKIGVFNYTNGNNLEKVEYLDQRSYLIGTKFTDGTRTIEIEPDYVYQGVLSQFAFRMQGGKLYAAEGGPEWDTLYKWENTLYGKKYVPGNKVGIFKWVPRRNNM